MYRHAALLRDAQKLRLELTVGAGDLAGMGCMVLPVRALARLPAFNVGQDGRVLEARVHAVVQKGHSVAAVVYVLAMAAQHIAKLLHVRPVQQYRPSWVLNKEMSLFPRERMMGGVWSGGFGAGAVFFGTKFLLSAHREVGLQRVISGEICALRLVQRRFGCRSGVSKVCRVVAGRNSDL